MAATDTITSIILIKLIRVSLVTVRHPRRFKIVVIDIQITLKQMLREFIGIRVNRDKKSGMVNIFFFQAEDGIRGWSVTGVQTCALPIFVPAPVETADGVKGADVVWLSPARHPGRERYTVMKVAPEICVEIFSPSNSSAEMEERRRLFFECRAEEVWQCDDGRMQFFASQGPIAASQLCPAFPNELKV